MAKNIIRKMIGAVLIIAAIVVYLIPPAAIDADTASTTDFLWVVKSSVGFKEPHLQRTAALVG